MYICLCNGLTDRDVRGAVTRGARRVSEVHRQCGTAPQCGRCTGHIRGLVEETSAAGDPASVAA